MPNIHIDNYGVIKLLSRLNPSKANGPDLLPTRVLKEAAIEIAPYLCFIFQQPINTGEVPPDEHANVIAIFKKGSRSEAVNYRPVSLTSVPCKLLEPIRHLAWKRGTCIIAHRRLKIRPTSRWWDQCWNMIVLCGIRIERIRNYGSNRSARFVTRIYTREEGCVTNALKQLNWRTLEKRREVARLTLMYKCVTNQTAKDIPGYVHHRSSLKTRSFHPLKFIPLQPSCNTYKYSFWPRTIIDWNSLPPNFLTLDSAAKF